VDARAIAGSKLHRSITVHLRRSSLNHLLYLLSDLSDTATAAASAVDVLFVLLTAVRSSVEGLRGPMGTISLLCVRCESMVNRDTNPTESACLSRLRWSCHHWHGTSAGEVQVGNCIAIRFACERASLPQTVHFVLLHCCKRIQHIVATSSTVHVC